MYIFQSEHYTVRPLFASDVEIYTAIHGSTQVMQFIRPAKSREACIQLIQEHIELNKDLAPFGRWVIEEKSTGRAIGTYVIVPTDSAGKWQLGYALIPEYWGKGISTEITQACIQWLKTLSIVNTIYAITEKEHLASQKVLEKNGFRWYDQKAEAGKLLIWWECTL